MLRDQDGTSFCCVGEKSILSSVCDAAKLVLVMGPKSWYLAVKCKGKAASNRSKVVYARESRAKRRMIVNVVKIEGK